MYGLWEGGRMGAEAVKECEVSRVCMDYGREAEWVLRL